MTIAEILEGLAYFSDLPEELLREVCDASEQLELAEGDVIIEEGTTSEEMYVVVDGELIVTKSSQNKIIELGRINAGEVVGELALVDKAPRTATVSAAKPTTVVRVPAASFDRLLNDPRVARRMFHTVTSRLRSTEQTLRHEERMAALGRMAAQLMHELNNPAAAVGRTSQELSKVYAQLGDELQVLAGALGTGDFQRPEPPEALGALERADAENAISTWLDQHGVEQPWELAPGLVDAGWTETELSKLIAGVDPETVPHILRFAGLRAAAGTLISEIGIGAHRISELVRVVKEYSYLDQAPVQDVEITKGIDDTLILLKHKLRGIEVVKSYQDGLHRVEAPGRDLNQVWTNLIDNAADAMGEGGRLTIDAFNQDSMVVVRFHDTGPGIPKEIAERIFDPFFTTKEPGKGTGLGLHTVHTIVGRVGGNITVDTDGSGTTFIVTLPSAA